MLRQAGVTTDYKWVMSQQGSRTVGPSSAQGGDVPIQLWVTKPGVILNPSGCRDRRFTPGSFSKGQQHKNVMVVLEGLGWDEAGFAPMPLFSTAGKASCNSPRDEPGDGM